MGDDRVAARVCDTVPGRREELLDAAVAVLAGGGARALTHRAVDSAADAPAGTASNHSRTRGALLTGVLEHVLAVETAHYRAAADTGDDADALARDTAAMLAYVVGPARERTVARLVLALADGVVLTRLRGGEVPGVERAARALLHRSDGA